MLALHAGRQHAVAQSQRRLQDSRRASGPLEMSEIRFHRAQRHRSYGGASARQGGREAFKLHDVADTGRSAVSLDERRSRRRDTRILPGALDRELLADRIRRGNPFPLAVAGRSHAAQHGVDPVAVAFGIGQPLHEEDRGAFAHDEAVGALGVRPASGPRKRADLAELDERGGAHVAVDPACQRDVELVFSQAFHRRTDGGHGGRARRIAHKVRAPEVKHVRHPAGKTVRQLAGHGVFGDLGEQPADPLLIFARDRAADRGRKRMEGRGCLQLPGVFWKIRAQNRSIVPLSGHRVAQNDGCPLGVQRTLRVAIVQQGFPRRRDRPLLRVVHGRSHARRDREAPWQGFPRILPHPPADLGIRFVGRIVVGIVKQRRVPPVRRHLRDAIASGRRVLPESGHIHGVRQHPAAAHNGDRSISSVLHHDALQ